MKSEYALVKKSIVGPFPPYSFGKLSQGMSEVSTFLLSPLCKCSCKKETINIIGNKQRLTVSFYSASELFFHECSENIHYNMNIQRSVNVVHSLRTDWIDVLNFHNVTSF